MGVHSIDSGRPIGLQSVALLSRSQDVDRSVLVMPQLQPQLQKK